MVTFMLIALLIMTTKITPRSSQSVASHPRNITEIIDSLSPKMTDFYNDDKSEQGTYLDVDNASEREVTPSLWLMTLCILTIKVILKIFDT